MAFSQRRSRRSRRTGGGVGSSWSPATLGGRRSRRRSRRGGNGLPTLSPALYGQDSGIGYNGITTPVGAGSAALSGGRRRRSRRSRRR